MPRLFSESLRQNILMGLDLGDDEVREAMRRAVLEDDLAALEKGLDSVIGPRGVKLSGGQLQRTAAARMFVRDPDLLVFDDLSSALDVETESRCGSGSSRVRGGPASWCRTVGRRCAGPTPSSS